MEPNSTGRLPNLAVGPADVSRLKRELASLNEYLQQASLRGQADIKLPKTSRMLDELATINKLNFLEAPARQAAANFLEAVLKAAPVVHISLATDPSSAFTDKMISWFRQNVHPLLLLQVGLQPSIAAGCVVRTPNKQYDLSVRKHFAGQRPVLIDKLRELAAA